jgi:hypothetical protein
MKYNKKQLNTIKIIDNLLKQHHNGKYKGGDITNVIGNDISSKDMKKKEIGQVFNNGILNSFKQKIENLPKKKHLISSVIINEIFSFLKDIGEILCSYGIDLELIIYNTNKKAMETGIFYEFYLKRLAKDIKETLEGYGINIMHIVSDTGFSFEELINKIVERLYAEGIYKCPIRDTELKNIDIDRPITENPDRKNELRDILKELFGRKDLFGEIIGKKTTNGPIGLESNIKKNSIQRIGGNKKSKSHKNKIQGNNTRKRYKR